jgi:hypothetical protein
MVSKAFDKANLSGQDNAICNKKINSLSKAWNEGLLASYLEQGGRLLASTMDFQQA